MDWFHYRKLKEDRNSNITEITEICLPYCDPTNGLGYCEAPCLDFCDSICPSELPPMTSPTLSFDHKSSPNGILMTSLIVLATTFVLVFCYATYVCLCRRRQRRWRLIRTRISNRIDRTRTAPGEFLDDEHGPVVDHPIWHINTVGLQPSVIDLIGVFKYRKGDGVVDGTECSVCLSEFEEDETLRLLPKCSHAFHVSCIDTWLRSHTNCPLCRAPIVVNANIITTPTSAMTTGEGEVGGSSFRGEARIVISEDQESDDRREYEIRVGEMRSEAEEELDRLANEIDFQSKMGEDDEGMQSIRRSVSLDSLTAFNISQAVVATTTNVPDKSERNLDAQAMKEVKPDSKLRAKRGGANKSLVPEMTSSSNGRSFNIGSSSLTRSFSCSGKLFLSRYYKHRNQVLPF